MFNLVAAGKKALRILSLVSALIISSNHIYAQWSPGALSDANQPSGAPDPSKQDQIWQVDPITGALNVKIPFGTTPQGGRGVKVPFALLYNSSSTVTLQTADTHVSGSSEGVVCFDNAAGGASCNLQGAGTNYAAPSQVVTDFVWSSKPLDVPKGPTGPWTTTGPFIYSAIATFNPDTATFGSSGQITVNQAGCTIQGPYIYVDENGDSHDMNLNNVTNINMNGAGGSPCIAHAPKTTGGTSGDGSNFTTDTNDVVYPNGTVLSNPSAGVYQFKDSNGNITSISQDAEGRSPFTTNIPIGAAGPIPIGQYSVATTGQHGSVESYTVTFSEITLGTFAMPHPADGSNEIYSPQCTLSVMCPQYLTPNQLPAGSTINGVTSITLPDDTSSYGFVYDPKYGTVSQINFPTGGYVRFVYGIRADGCGNSAYAKLSTIVVTDVYISDDTTGEKHWAYTFANCPISGGLTSSVTSPDGTVTQYTGQGFTYSQYFPGSPSWKEINRTITNSSGTLVKTIATAYSTSGNASIFPLQVTTTLYDGPTPLQQQDQYQYTTSTSGLVTEKDESDFYTCTSPCTPPSTLSSSQWLRHTYTNYWSGGSIVDKPSQILVTDGAGHPYSLTVYRYDELTVQPAAGYSNHDDTNYSPTAPVARGNLTHEHHCSTLSQAAIYNASNAANATASCSAWLSTAHYYDETGQPLNTIDPSGKTTSYNYDDNYTGGTPAQSTHSYLKSVTHPNGASDVYAYDLYTGAMTSHQDWNLQTTQYTYSDPFNRLRSIVAPSTVDGTTGATGSATTSYNYTDSPGAFTIQELHTVDTGGTQTSSTKSFDGLGRLIKSKTASPQCSSGIVTATSYDSMGRVSSVSNPYCSISDATYGTTQFLYDALGRKTKTTLPDGSATLTSYAGNATETTDPFNGTTNVQHIQQVNGLGWLTSVCEVASSLGSGTPSPCGLNISGTGYLTAYSYIGPTGYADPSGNLQCVEQHGGVSGTGCSSSSSSDATSAWHVRRFTYDALSRLVSAKNPEAGASPSVYTYSTSSTSICSGDERSPCIKTDTRGVVTSFLYDNMGRLRGKSYSAGTGNTTGPISDLSSCYQYDTKLSASIDSYPSGRLTAEWQQSGTCPATAQSTIPTGAVAVRVFSNHDAMGRVGKDQQCLTASSCSATLGNFIYSYNLLGNPIQTNNGIYASTVTANQTNTANATPITSPSLTWKTTYDGMDHIATSYVQDQPTSTGTSPVWPASTFLTAPTLLGPTNYDPFGHMTAAQYGISTPYASSPAAIGMSSQYDNRGRIGMVVDTGQNFASAATHSIGTISITGMEQLPTYPASSYARATITINGMEQDNTFDMCPPQFGGCPTQIPDTGNVTVTINGVQASTSYGFGTTNSQIAQNLASSINSATTLVKASYSGATLTLKATAVGTSGNGIAVTTSSVTTQTSYYSGPSFNASPASTTTSGGTNVPQNVYDSGTVQAVIGGTTVNVTYNSTSTPQSIASQMASAIQTALGTTITAKSDGDINVLVSDSSGSGTDYTITTSVTYDTTDFTQPSFAATAYSMADGYAADANHGLLYWYVVPGGGYAPNGNILAQSDSVMGDWYFTYDAVDRLLTATPDVTAPSQYLGNYGCWGYDAFGNRTLEAFSTVACTGSPTPQVAATYSNVSNNQVTSINGGTAATFSYDASGNTLWDGWNRYWFSAEGQLCAVQSWRTGSGGAVYQYVYDGSGARIGRGTLAAAPSSSTATCAPPLGSGFTLTNWYLVDQGGDQVTELAGALGSSTWKHSNIWSGGRLAGTYDIKGLHFDLSDPLGTKRVQANVGGYMDESCTGLPFGNDLNNPVSANCTQVTNPLNTADDATEHHFTGKERDSESGNDYFEARYYSSAMGRFMSPDWSSKEEPVPYAKLDNPQSLNLYSYVLNHPTTGIDPDGHDVQQQAKQNWIAYHQIGNSTNEQLQAAGLVRLSTQAQQQNTGTTTVTVNNRQANIPGGAVLDAIGIDHQWITFDGVSVGMGTAQGVPQSDAPGVQTQVVDHTGQVATSTQTFTGVDRAALSTYTQVGTPTGRWLPGVNDCNTWVQNVVSQSTPHDIYDRAPVVTRNGVIPGHVAYHNVVVYADGSIHSLGGQ